MVKPGSTAICYHATVGNRRIILVLIVCQSLLDDKTPCRVVGIDSVTHTVTVASPDCTESPRHSPWARALSALGKVMVKAYLPPQLALQLHALAQSSWIKHR